MTPLKSMRGNGLAWLLALACVWIWTWWHLSVEWETNDQYQYGFVVPFLFVYLAVQRWQGSFCEHPGNRCTSLASGAAWLLLLFGELLRQHDPIWRLTGTSLMAAATAVTAVWLHRCGGLALVRAQAFPLAFAWLALPWPVPVEFYLTQHILAVLSSGIVFLLHCGGIAALQHSNAVELANGMVGIDTACSGIQSFQASLMAGLFLGDFYHLAWVRRGWLLGLSWLAAMAANFARIFFLACCVHRLGENGIAAYHDKAGYIASAMTFALILVFASRLAARSNLLPGNGITARSFALSGKDGFVLLFGLFFIPLGAWSFFAMVTDRSLNTFAAPCWTLHPEALPKGWQVEDWKPGLTESSMLRYSERQAVSLRTSSGSAAHLVHFFWKPGKSMPSVAFYHTPQMCMPWVGWNEIDTPRSVTLAVHGAALPCVKYRFRIEEIRLVVYQALCASGRPSAFMLNPEALAGRGERLSMLWRAPREQVNEELLVYLPVSENSDQKSENHLAEEILEQVLLPSLRAP